MKSAETHNERSQGERQRRLRAARRIVVKLGTSTVTGADGDISIDRLRALVGSMARLREDGRQIVLVSSGAVGLGRGRLGLHRARTHDVVLRQACAAVGQPLLMHAYEELFGAEHINIAQVLLTEEDFTARRRYSNLRHAMEKLLKLGVLPIVNENDTVSTAELEYISPDAGARVFSDNDRLAALVMSKLDADALVLLTDVDGLLRDPGQAAATVIAVVEEVTPELRALACGRSLDGRGGMLTKLEAAEIAMRAGGVAVIANGRRAGVLERVLNGENVGTAFMSQSRMAGKRRWIAYAADVHGRVVVNAGACAALTTGKASLLWSGVVKVEEGFEPMDVISILDSDGREFARGIANHGNREVEELTGKPPVLVTRNNIVLLDRL
jgi:glutamate 5-kinase